MSDNMITNKESDPFEAIRRNNAKVLFRASLKQYNAHVKEGLPPVEKPSFLERIMRKLNKRYRVNADWYRCGLIRKPIWLSDKEKMKLFKDPRIEKDVYILGIDSSGEINVKIVFNDIPDYLLPKRKPSKTKKRPPTRWWRTPISPMGIINKLKRKRGGLF